MNTNPSLEALALFLPHKALEYFDITEASRVDEEVCLTLTEKNVPPKTEGSGTPHFHSYYSLTASDFPIRGVASVITFKRRYWKLEGQKELLMTDIPLVFPGTKLESAFASFLKEGSRE